MTRTERGRLTSEELISEKARLEKEIADTKRRFPAHSLKPAMMNQLEELEERLARVERDLTVRRVNAPDYRPDN